MEKKSARKPLSGVRILVGRARHQASVLSSSLVSLGAEVIEIPFIEIRKPKSYGALDQSLLNIGNYDWMIFTSVNGVDAVWTRLEKLAISNDSLRHLKIAAIGPATKHAILDRGLHVDVVPQKYVAESVVHSLRRRVKGQSILLARAKGARDVIPDELRKLGAHVDVVEAYETIVPESSRKLLSRAFETKRPHAITFTSSSTVRNFVALAGKSELEGIRFASIGPITSATLRELKLAVDIEAEEYTIPGLVAAVVKYRRQLKGI